MTIVISGTITLHVSQSNALEEYQFDADDFIEDKGPDGSSTYSYNGGHWSIQIIVEEKQGVLSIGDWLTYNCKIIHNAIKFSIG